MYTFSNCETDGGAMASREDLIKEAKALRLSYRNTTSVTERARLEKRYNELDRRLRTEQNRKSLAVEGVAQLTTPSTASVLESFPPKEIEVNRHTSGEWKRFILPALLLTIVVIVLALVYISTPRKNPALAQPTDSLPATMRVETAKSLEKSGDAAWDKGYKGWNSEADLRDAVNYYKQAWRELTSGDWGGGDKSADPIIDSADGRALREKLLYRIPALEDTLNSWSPLR
jgi:hypothetical protein